VPDFACTGMLLLSGIALVPLPLPLKALNLLLVGDERKNHRMLAWGFSAGTFHVRMTSAHAEMTELLNTERFHVACIDWKMRDANADELASLLRERVPTLPIVAITSGTGGEQTRGAKLRGVSAQLVAPIAIEELHETLRRHALDEPAPCVEPRIETMAPRKSERGVASPMTLADEAARRARDLALRAAKSPAAILILGETGTGKSVLAQTIHEHSTLRERPFVTVNCPCLSHELLESDLFGHLRGSFTGAVQDTWGKVAAADGGTLFLDEVGDLPMSIQPKLLRLLQEKQYERVGETVSRTANVRIIAATNRDLKREVEAGRFREDLYYRLNVIAIDVPALRGRPSQIMGAAEAFLADIADNLGKTPPRFSPEARRILETYGWPGNLRELRNVVERAAILASGPMLEPLDFPALLAQEPAVRYKVGGAFSLAALESAHIQMVVASCASLEEAARVLEIDKSTLYRKRKQISASVAPFAMPSEGMMAHAQAG
jgi:NtrC-family two-component system response regulator AlgB